MGAAYKSMRKGLLYQSCHSKTASQVVTGNVAFPELLAQSTGSFIAGSPLPQNNCFLLLLPLGRTFCESYNFMNDLSLVGFMI